MNPEPLVSVVITNYNYGRYLSECIDSVLGQTYPNTEVIVVDDGSIDNSLAVLQPYGDRITIIAQSNKGVSAARNAGIFRSKGEWIAFLDADDSWRPEKLREQSKYFYDSSVGMVFCGLEYVDDLGRFLGSTQAIAADDLLPQLVTFTSPPIGGSTAVVRADLVRGLGGFDESLSAPEDLDMWIRIAAQHRIRVVAAPLIKYRRHPGSLGSKLALFESYNYRVLMKTFSNPAFARVRHLRRRSFGRFYMIVAGSHLHERYFVQAIRYTLKALVYRPLEIIHLLGLPVRVLRRHSARPVAIRDGTHLPIRVLHVTSAQTACYGIRELVDNCDHRIVEFIVTTLTGEGTFAAELRKRGVTVYCLNSTKRSQYLKGIRALVGIIRKQRVDVVHTHLVEPTWIGLIAARLTARPIIITRHYSDLLYRIENRFNRYAYHILERCCGRLAAHIIAPSKCVLRILVNREGVPAAKVSLIPHGQDTRRFEAITAMNVSRVENELGMEHKPALVCVSRLHPEKGHIYLFEAFSALKREVPALSLYLVGEGPCRAVLESAALKAGLSNSIRFLGWRDDALEILAAADVVVHSSLSEAFGLAVVEAIALGKPVVCTDTADVREILGPYARIVPPADSDALVEGLRSTLLNLEDANRLAARGKAHILGSLTASTMAQRHSDVYRDVMAKRRGWLV